MENIAHVKRIDTVIARGKAYPRASLQNLLRAVRKQVSPSLNGLPTVA